ncbi:MAG: hypothetical protein Tsb0015_12380 [Simkaniaceae bacterium]
MSLEVQKTQSWYPWDFTTAPSLLAGAAAGAGISKFDNKVVWQIFQKNAPKPLQTSALSVLKHAKAGNSRSLAAAGLRVNFLFPVLEESIYRGLIYEWQKEETGTFHENRKDDELSKLKNIAANAALFAVSHFDWKIGMKNSLKLMPGMFAAGTVFCGLAEISGNLWAPTAAHITANTLNFQALLNSAKKVPGKL